MTISYTSSLAEFDQLDLGGFFVGWPNPPDKTNFKRILRGASHVILATEGGQLVGFINALTDGVLSAYIPLLEVKPSHQGRGLGKELVRRMLKELDGLYGIDLLCDAELQGFYEDLGMRRATGMMIRRWEHQRGRPASQSQML